MADNFTPEKCPNCGADLSVEQGKNMLFCSNCGTKIVMTNENEYTDRHIDEANIKSAETEQSIPLRELEMAEKRKNRKSKRIWLAVSLVLIIIVVIFKILEDAGRMPRFSALYTLLLICAPTIGIGAFLAFKAYPQVERQKVIRLSGGVQIPKSIEPINIMNFSRVEEILRDAGFTNVACFNLHDCIEFDDPSYDFAQGVGKVESITVNGVKIESGGKYYYPDADITIMYHGK